MIFNKNGFTPQEMSFVKKALKKITGTLDGLITTAYSTDATKAYSTTYINSVVGNIETALISLRGVISDGNSGSDSSARKRQKRNS